MKEIKKLSDLPESVFEKEYFINEYIIWQYHRMDSEDCDKYANYDDAEISNQYRRFILILFYLLSKQTKGINFTPLSSEPVGYEDWSRTEPLQDFEAYSECMEAFLEEYHWNFPSGWNTLYNKRVREYYQDTKELVQYLLESNKRTEDEIEIEMTFPTITTHNSLFDKIYNIHMSLASKANCEEISEYADIWRQVSNIGCYSIMHDELEIDSNSYGGMVYFTTLYDGFIDYFEQANPINLRRVLRPSLLLSVPKLNKNMLDYMEKWGATS